MPRSKGRAGPEAGPQDRQPDPGQGGRHRAARCRGDQRGAAEPRPGRRGDADGPHERRYGDLAGRIRKWQGKLLGHDMAKLRRELEASRDYIFEKAGIRHDLFA
jgi:hypothetical protein